MNLSYGAYRRWLYVMFVALSAGMILFQPVTRVVAFSVIDDAMYYLKVAGNIASTGFWSYDGITATNGFHPLWMVVLVPLRFLIRDPFSAVQVSYWLVFGILLACIAVLARIGVRLGFTGSGLLVAGFVLLLNLRSFTIFYSLLESHLVLLCQLCYLLFALTIGERRFSHARFAFLNGALIGLCFLARLDSFLLALTYGAVLLWKTVGQRRSWTEFRNAAVASALGCLVLALPYLLINVLVFGHLGTVSASMKQATPSLDSFAVIAGWYRSQLIPRVHHILGLGTMNEDVLAAVLAAVPLAIALGIAWIMWRRAYWSRVASIADYMAFAAAHLVFICATAPTEAIASAWYLVPELIAGGLLLGLCTRNVSIARVPVVALVVTILCVLQLAVYPRFVARKTMTYAKLEMADYLRGHLPEASRSAMFDSGVVSFFSDRDVVALNGLIGDFEMADLVRKGRMADLLRKYQVETLILDTPVEVLPSVAGNVVYVTSIRTKFGDFREAEKPFVLYRGSPEELARVWRIRYHLE